MADTSLVFNILAKDKASGTFDKIKAKAALLGVAVGALAAKFGGDAVKNASDLNETISKTDVIFGKASPAVMKFASTSATAMGQSKRSALDAVDTFAALGKGAGLSGQDLVGFSTKLTGLSSDLASFANTSPEDAITAVSAALRGESEPIRRYGVLLDEASIKAQAMSMGLVKASKDTDKIRIYQLKAITAQRNYNDAVKKHGKNSDEAIRAQSSLLSVQALLAKATTGTIAPLTQQQKVLAAQALILKQTTDAQGDFARTSDGLANRQRILKARYEDISATVGMKLLPAITTLAGWVLKTMNFTQKYGDIIVPVVAVLGTAAGAIWAVNKATKAYAATQAALDIVLTANPIGLVIAAIALLVVGLVIAYKRSETFRNAVNDGFHQIATAGKFMWGVLKGVFKIWANTWLTLVGMLVHGAAKAFGWLPQIGGPLRKAARDFDRFRDHVNASLSGIQKTVPISFVAIGAGGAPNSRYAGKQLPIDGVVGGGGGAVVKHLKSIDTNVKRRNRPDPLTAGFGAT